MALADVSAILVSGGVGTDVAIDLSVQSPITGSLVVGMQQTENSRQVEIVSAIKQLRDLALENELLGLGTGFTIELPIAGTKAEIVVTESPDAPTADGVYISVAADYPDVGNEIFHSDVTICLNQLMNDYLKGV